MARAGRCWWKVSLPLTLSLAVGCEPIHDDRPVAPDDPAAPVTIPLAGDNASGENLGGSNLGGANLGGSNLGGVNLGGSNLGGVNLGGNNLGGSNLGGSNLGGANLGGSNLGGSNLGGSNLGGSNLGGSNLGGSNLGGNNLLGTNLGGSNLGGSNTGLNIHGLTVPMNGMLYSGEDLWLPKTGQCIVMGIGSSAFSRLLGQQTAGAKISIAVGKLPWGFAATAGGPIGLAAWEAVVWGDKTYCSFVLAAPTDATWAGVAGFLKAVFRWHAPPGQLVEISGIEASAPHDPTLSTGIHVHSGMMDAAARWRAGQIDDANLVAGELAFISATTNNQSVRVDFSSWVTDVNGNGLILGQVESTRPRYAEAVFYSYDNGDGSVGVGVARGSLSNSALSWGGPNGGEIYSASDLDLSSSYRAYLAGMSPRPIATRCAAALYLWSSFGEEVPAGKCDSGLAWNGSVPPTSRKWQTVSGTTAPLNAFMMLPQDGSTPYQRDGKRVLSETYIHMWEPNHYLVAAPIGESASGDRSELGVAVSTATACAANQTATQAFDNDRGTTWCTSGVPSTSAPRSIMYRWGAALPVTAYAITSASNYSARDPRNWTFQGCNGSCTAGSDTGWVTLDTRTGQTFSSRLLARRYAISNSTAYPQYRLRVTANNGDGSALQIGEIELFGSGAVVPLSGGDLTENGIVHWTGVACSLAENASRAFDNLASGAAATDWCALLNGGTMPTSIMYGWPGVSRRVTSYTVTSATDSPERDPRDWKFQGCAGECFAGSDDGWVTLDTRSGQTFSSRLLKRTFTVSSPGTYARYRLRITATASSAYLQIGEIQMFDSASCTPESNATFCARVGKNCGTVSAADNCGVLRTVTSCGTCTSPQSCGGGGLANVCGGGSSCSFSVSQNAYDGPRYWGSITFKNTGAAPASNYRVEFDVPSGMNCTNDAVPSGAVLSPLVGSGHSAYTVSNHCVFTWTNTTPLAPGASKTFNYSANRTTTFDARASTIVRDAICNP